MTLQLLGGLARYAYAYECLIFTHHRHTNTRESRERCALGVEMTLRTHLPSVETEHHARLDETFPTAMIRVTNRFHIHTKV